MADLGFDSSSPAYGAFVVCCAVLPLSPTHIHLNTKLLISSLDSIAWYRLTVFVKERSTAKVNYSKFLHWSMTRIGTTCSVSTDGCFGQRMGPEAFLMWWNNNTYNPAMWKECVMGELHKYVLLHLNDIIP